MDWTQLLTTGGAISAFGIAVATWIKTRPQWIVAKSQADGPVWARLAAVEERLELERTSCDERIARVEERHEAAVAELKAEVQVLRHDRNNLRQGFNYIVVRLQRHTDEELQQIAADAKAMVDEGDKKIAIERAAIPSKGRKA